MAKWNWLDLQGDQLSTLADAIAASFDLSELRRLTRVHMDVRLDRVVNTNSPVDKVVFDLLGWTNRQGRTEKLFAAVARQRPEDARIKSIVESSGITLAEAPIDFLKGISRERSSGRGRFAKLLILLPLLNFIPGLSPLTPSSIVQTFIAAMFLTIAIVTATFLMASIGSNVRRGLVGITAVASIAVALHYFHLREEYVYCQKNEDESICFMMGDEFTEVASIVRPQVDGVHELVKKFSSPDQIWTEESIKRIRLTLRNWWFSLWALASVCIGCLLLELRYLPKIQEKS